MLKKILYITGSGILFLFLFSSCSSSRYLAEGDYLLAKNEVRISGKTADVTKKKILPYIRQQANTSSLLNFKFYLGIYNASPKCDSCRVGNIMKKIGEAPVVFDSAMVRSSVNNIGQYLRSMGYYHASVKDTVRYSRHRAKVTYTVAPGRPVTLNGIRYRIQDSILRPFILNDTAQSLLEKGMPLSLQLLERERERVETSLHAKGFSSFSRMLISYDADTLAGNDRADITMLLNTDKLPKSNDTLEYNKRFRIGTVRIYTQYDAVEASLDSNYMKGYTEVPAKTTRAGSIHVLYRHRQPVRTSVLLSANTIEPGDYYNGDQNAQTYANFSNLRLFRIISINFQKAHSPDGDTLVDCSIYLVPGAAQGFKINMEASVSSFGLLGLSPALSYYHRNIFRGAEWFNISLSENFQFDPFHIDDSRKRSNELSISGTVGTPKFFAPFINRYFSIYSPQTEFTTAYGYQLRPEYTRNSLTFLLGYNWRTKPQLSYTLNIVNLNIVKLFNMSEEFYRSTLSDPYLRNRYENHFVLGASASFLYSTRQPSNKSHSVQLRWTIGSAGNLLSAFNKSLAYNPGDNNYLVWGTPYSQYIKTDMNFSHYLVLGDKHILAYRLFAGIGRAYGNSISLPYEEVYYSGGAYSLRGWQSRTVGPGAAAMDSTFSIPNQVGDFKMEANVEYRFKMSGIFDGALFLDAGNVWSLNYKEADELAVLKAATFLKQIALNTGVGLRLNFDFLIVRFDIGAKLYEPRRYSGWVNAPNILALQNLSLHFGIGYPF
ncbi:MAG: BamA/TamA family outer membrane protein [Prevotellaceae bacterium]|nr:BamA/TamA family outer membrane protein [Prevotellaceae bacterium]